MNNIKENLIGKTIIHSNFGKGIVEGINEYRDGIIVRFSQGKLCLSLDSDDFYIEFTDYKGEKHSFTVSKYSEKILEIQNAELEYHKTQIIDFFMNFDFRAAKKYYDSYLSSKDCVEWFQENWDYFNAIFDVDKVLRQYDFQEADKYANFFTVDEYESLKTKYVKEWFLKSISENGKPYFLDDQQTMAVLNTNKNTIVAARAGSGKTRTLVAKIIYLVAKYDVKPNELLVFVFNSSAANEINGRLENILCDGKKLFNECRVATTFHKFARHIVYDLCRDHYGKILSDEENSTRNYFIQQITRLIPKDKIYEFFRQESYQIRKDRYASEEDFYDSLRVTLGSHKTLDGIEVKSAAEKIIGDYLFEHGIKYRYEHPLYLSAANKLCQSQLKKKLWEIKNKWGRETIKPDFQLADYNIYWEHWAITGKETLKEIERINKSKIIGAYNSYKEEMDWKKWFYSKEWIDKQNTNRIVHNYATDGILSMNGFIETYRPCDMKRKEFEEVIKDNLHKYGIDNEKLPKEKLIELVWQKQINRFTQMIVQFIDRTQQQFYDNPVDLYNTIKDIVSNKSDDEEVEKVNDFLKIGWTCYVDYVKYLCGQELKNDLDFEIAEKGDITNKSFSDYGIDFNILMKRAVDLLRHDNNGELSKELHQVKHILIDEYQDFTKLFLAVVNETRNLCPESNLFVVGDDWQSINRFAGADSKFFENFEEYFDEDSRRLELFTNYRCAEIIVDNAKKFVKKVMRDDSDYVAFREDAGCVFRIPISEDSYISQTDKMYTICKACMAKNSSGNVSKREVLYLMNVVQVIYDNIDCESIMILHRNNDISFGWRIMSITDFKNRIQEALWKIYNVEKEVDIRTMHRAKGLEADCVIILEANNGIVPRSVYDYVYYEIFGDNPSILMKEQMKLFYVAITRAKNKLFIFHDVGASLNQSEFLSELDLPKYSMNLSDVKKNKEQQIDLPNDLITSDF